MNTFFLWWHRRWAGHHDAWRAYDYTKGLNAMSMFREAKRNWHLEQIKRLSAPERKPPASGIRPVQIGSETARD